MTITAGQLLFCLSGGTANTDPNASLGGGKSNTTLSDNTSNNLFDDVSAGEASSGDVEYRGIFVMNTSTETLSAAYVTISVNTPAPGDVIYWTTDTIGINNNNTMSTISNESTAPTATGTWVTGSLSIGSMLPTKSIGVWVMRTVSVGAGSYANNTATFVFTGETA